MTKTPGNLQLSRYNIISRIKDGNSYIIANLLSGHADILSTIEYNELLSLTGSSTHIFIQKGYLAFPEEEETRFRLGYIDFLENRDKEEVQVFFVPTYSWGIQLHF